MLNKYDITSLPSGLFSASQVNLWLFILLSCGIILGRLMPIILVYAAASCIACTCAVMNRRNRIRGSVISISVFFVCLGALLYIFSYPVRDVPPLKQVRTYRVKVSSLPLPRHLRNMFFADVSLADHRSARLRVRVMDYTRSMEYLRAYQVEAKLTGNVYQSRPYYTLWVDSRVKPLPEPADAYTALSRSMNLRVLEIFKNTLSDEGYRFLASVFMGRRELLERGEKTIFTDAGIAHLLAISGSNIGLAAIVVFFLLQLFGIKFRPCLAISVVFLACYMVLTGPNPPIVRAVIMYTILAAGFFLKRKVNALNSFGLAGLVCLVFDPGWLFDVSFQLSFLSIGALIIGFKLYAPAPTKYGLFDYVRYIFLSSLWVTVFIAPLVAYYFKRFYILSVFHNIVLIPFFSFILTLCFLLLFLAPFTLCAQAVGASLSACINAFYVVARYLGSIPCTYVDCTFSKSGVVIYYVILAALVVAAPFMKGVIRARLSSFNWKRPFG